MDGFGSGPRYGGFERGNETVSGKSYGASRSQYSPDPGTIPGRTSRASRADLKPWSFGENPESARKRRVYKYKVYTVEGKVKASLKKGLRWIKNKCSQIVRGY